MARLNNITAFLMLMSLLSSCKENKRITASKAIVMEWIGKTVTFPSDVQCCIAGNDTLPSVCDGLFEKDFKILLYVDSAGCSSCRLKLLEWKERICF